MKQLCAINVPLLDRMAVETPVYSIDAVAWMPLYTSIEQPDDKNVAWEAVTRRFTEEVTQLQKAGAICKDPLMRMGAAKYAAR